VLPPHRISHKGHGREIARLSFEGRLQATAEEKGKAAATLPFVPWDAMVS